MLTDSKVRQLRPNGRVQKVSDGGGLFIQVAASGTKSWRLAYRYGGRQMTYTIGQYPVVSLAEARRAREELKHLLAQGIDPSAKKQEEKAAAARPEGITFEEAALEWLGKKRTEVAPVTAEKSLERLRKHLFPVIGDIPIARLCRKDVLRAVRVCEAAGHASTAHRVARLAAQACAYAQICDYCENNAAAGLTRVLAKPVGRRMPAVVTPDGFGGVLAELENIRGHYSIIYALRLLPYVFLRISELCGGRWEEADLDAGMWIIPAGRMKKRREHAVPLARQVVTLLRELKELDGGGEFMFPSSYFRGRAITTDGLQQAFRRLDIPRGKMCLHGFRSSASTLLNSMGKYPPDVIEAQLAHSQRDPVRAAYNRADYMAQRREMMQDWADYIDDLRNGAIRRVEK